MGGIYCNAERCALLITNQEARTTEVGWAQSTGGLANQTELCNAGSNGSESASRNPPTDDCIVMRLNDRRLVSRLEFADIDLTPGMARCSGAWWRVQ